MVERFTLDAETHYSKEYSLRKMSPAEYILDARFEMIMLSVKRPNKPVFNLSGDKIEKFFRALDPKDTIMLTYNALFDQCIFAWHYNFVPKLMIDVMGMVRAWHSHELRSVALAVAAPHIIGRHKGTAVHKMEGLHAADIVAAGWWKEYEKYCGDDSELAEGIFDKIMGEGFPLSELIVMDHVLRMAVHPQFAVNGNELAVHLQNITTDKANLLAACGLVYDANGKCKDLMSNDKFSQLLTSQGIDPPRKISPTTGRETWAFSKADQEFTDLEDHPNTNVQTLVAARMGHKSTIEETRAQRFLSISQLQWPDRYLAWRGLPPGTQLAPMPLRYAGAHTHRLSGDWKLNVQNFPSRGKVNHLKRALMAQAGSKVVNTDSSQIEARIVAWLCGEWELLKQFELGLDPYKIFAAKVFQIDVSQVSESQRFLGKTALLGLGFSLGWVKFKHQVRVKSLEALKISGKGRELILTDQESLVIVNTYRSTYPGKQSMWRALNAAISILAGFPGNFRIGPCVFMKGKVSLPNGLFLYYHNLRQTSDGWLYDHAGKPRRLYGGALLENCLSATTEVLTLVGWKNIVDVLLTDKVWDGVEWVHHDGLVSRGTKETISINGVRMTPDHKVLTIHGWVRAAQTEGLHGAEVWHPHGSERYWEYGEEESLASSVRLRHDREVQHLRLDTSNKLRVPNENTPNETEVSWDVVPSDVLGVEVYDRPLQTSNTSRMGPVWRQGHHSLPPMGEVREFQGGYVSGIPEGFNHRTQKQFEGVFPEQLLLGYACETSTQQAQQPNDRYPEGENAGGGSRRDIRHKRDHDPLQGRAQLAGEKVISSAKLPEPVFDLTNCGPRNQFVVRGSTGPFIVHNCVQALARIIVMDASCRIATSFKNNGWGDIQLALQVHDALAYTVPDNLVAPVQDIMQEEMNRRPAFAPELPLACETKVGSNYGDMK